MSNSRATNQNWLAGELAARFASVIEAMAGQRPTIQLEILTQVPAPALMEESRGWHQPFGGAPGAVWLHAAERDRHALGGYILRAGGVDHSDEDTLQSTYLEAAGQALSGMAQALSARLAREVSLSAGAASSAPPEDAVWAAMRFALDATTVTIHAGFERALLDGLGPAVLPSAHSIVAPAGSAMFDLLLDVELPVSVSFGRAQVPLKDVLKLTTGSIVELNRSIIEPVEVIVNNCVIARGEVVVVEGNFGVRIQHVVSRQERLRTLH